MNNPFDNQTVEYFKNCGQDVLKRAKQIDDCLTYRYQKQHLPYRVVS